MLAGRHYFYIWNNGCLQASNILCHNNFRGATGDKYWFFSGYHMHNTPQKSLVCDSVYFYFFNHWVYNCHASIMYELYAPPRVLNSDSFSFSFEHPINTSFWSLTAFQKWRKYSICCEINFQAVFFYYVTTHCFPALDFHRNYRNSAYHTFAGMNYEENAALPNVKLTMACMAWHVASAHAPFLFIHIYYYTS